MSTSRRINFKSTIKKVSHVAQPSLSLTGGALQVISHVIDDFNKTLVNRCLRKFKQTSKNGLMRVPVAVSAVKEVCSGKIRKLAVAEGNKCLMKFNCNIVHYNPTDKEIVNMKKKEKETDKARKQQLGTEFSKGLSNLTRLAFPNASLNSSAKQRVCKMLADLSKKMCDSARASGQAHNEITTEDLRRAVEINLPGEMRKHALAEGAKMIFFHESGRIPFTPTETRAQRHTETTLETTRKRKLVVRKVKSRAISKRRAGTPSPKPKRARVCTTSSKPKITGKRTSPKIKPKKRTISKRSTRTPSPKTKRARKRISSKRKISKRQVPIPKPKKTRRISLGRKPSKRRSIPKRKIRTPETSGPKRVRKISVAVKISKRKSTSKRRVCTTSSRPKITIKRISPKIKPKRRTRTPSPRRKRVRKRISPARKPSKRRSIPKRKTRPETSGPKRGRKTSVAVKISKRKSTSNRRVRTTSSRPKITRKRISPKIKPKGRTRTPSPRAKRVRKRISPARKPTRRNRISKRRARTASPVSKAKRRKISISKRSTKSSKALKKQKAVIISKRKTTKIGKSLKINEKTAIRGSKKPKPPKKDGGLSSASFEKGIKSLNSLFSQSLSSDALKLICNYLMTLTERLVNEIRDSSSTVGVGEVREAILIVFPTGLKELALARLSQATTTMQI